MDPTTVKLEDLARRHPEREEWDQRLADYALAYRGGEQFLRAAGNGSAVRSSGNALYDALATQTGRRARRFLWQLEGEPDTKYGNRWERASYVNYLGAICDFFRHWLYSAEPVIRPVEGDKTPEWWPTFYENANGGGANLLDVGRESFLDVLLGRRAGWLLGRADSVAGPGLDAGVVLSTYNAFEITDWQLDACGELEWVVLCKQSQRREFPAGRMSVEVVTYADRNEWHTWEVCKNGDGKQQIEYIGGSEHGLEAVPFVMREIPHGLWVADKLFSPCMSLFNRANMLEYAEHIGCYVQPYMKTREGKGALSRILGEGIILDLRAGDGQSESEEFGWLSPNVAPMQHIAERLRQDRDELYRIVHQMSLAVDSQAVGAIARSGASKVEDRRATEIVLAGYGRYELRALVKTANLLSRIHGDNTQWSGDGFNNFQVSSLDEEMQIAALLESLPLARMSPTLRKRAYGKLANRIVDQEDQSTKGTILKEIEDAVDMEQEAQSAPSMPRVPPVSDAPTEDKDQAEGEEADGDKKPEEMTANG